MKKPDTEIFCEKGEKVFEQFWDSGGPGAGADSECVFLYEGRYWAVSPDTGVGGPFTSLKEAFHKSEVLWITGATDWIDCSEMTADALARLIPEIQIDEPRIVEINGERWVVAPDGDRGSLEEQNLVALGYVHGNRPVDLIDAWLRFREDTARHDGDPRQQDFEFR